MNNQICEESEFPDIDFRLYFKGLRFPWMRWSGRRFQILNGRDGAGHDSVPDPQLALYHPGLGLTTTDTTLSMPTSIEVEVRRRTRAAVLTILGSLSMAVTYLVSQQFNMGGSLSIIPFIVLLLLLIKVVAMNALHFLSAHLRIQKYSWRFSICLTYVMVDLSQRGLAFADEDAALRNLAESLSRVPIGPANNETLSKLGAMSREAAVSFYKQFGEIIELSPPL